MCESCAECASLPPQQTDLYCGMLVAHEPGGTVQCDLVNSNLRDQPGVALIHANNVQYTCTCI